MSNYDIKYGTDKNTFSIIPVEIIGNTNGAPILRVFVPFDSEEWSAEANFGLATGKSVKIGLDFATTEQIDSDGDGNAETFWRFEAPFTSDVTRVVRQDANTLLTMSLNLVNIANPDFQETFELVNMQVSQNVSTDVTKLAVDDVTALEGKINLKRDRSSASLSSIDFAETNSITVDQTSGTGQGEYKVTVDELSQKIEDDIGGKSSFIGFATDAPAKDEVGGNIISPLTGNIVTRTISEDELPDPDFDATTAVEVNYTILASSVWEIAFEGAYKIGFAGLSGENTGTPFTQSIKAKTDGVSYDIQTLYYIYSDTNGLDADPFHTGAVINITSTTFSNQSKDNTVLQFEIDLGISERIYTVTRVMGTIGTLATAEIEDDSNTFSNWQVSTSLALSGKADKTPNAVEDNLQAQTADGNLKDSGIAIDDLALESKSNDFAEDITMAKTLTIDGLVDMINSLIVRQDVTIEGDLLVLGDKITGNVSTVEFEDLIPLFGLGNISDSLDLAVEWEQLTTNAHLKYFNSTDKKWRLGLIGTEQQVAFIQDSATNDLAFWNSSTNQFETTTPQLVKDYLDIQISDVEDLQASLDLLQSNIDEKITGIEVNGIPDIKSIIFDGDSTVIQSGPNEVTVDIIGGGQGEGIINDGQGAFDEILDMALIPTLADWTTTSQSTNTSVFELLDQNDGVDPNTVRTFKNKSDELELPLKYKFTISGTATNPNLTAETIDFIITKDTAPVGTLTVTISAATVQSDSTNNFTIINFLTTDPIDVEADWQLLLEASGALIHLEKLEFIIETEFTEGEASQDLMRTTIFAQSNTSKVDNAITTDGVVVYDTTNPQLADLVSNDNLDMVAGNKYTFNITGTMDGSQITWSKDNALNTYSIFEEDGTTPAIGTDYNTIPKLTVDFDGVKLSIVSLDKQVETNSSDILSNTVLTEINKDKVNQVMVNQAELNLKLKADALITDLDSRGVFGRDFVNDVDLQFIVDNFTETVDADYPATSTVIALTDTTGLIAGMEMTFQDTVSKEDVTIVSVDSGIQITITALVNSYTQANTAAIYRSFLNLLVPTLFNMVVNGDFASGTTNWSVLTGTIGAAANIYSSTGAGASASIRSQQLTSTAVLEGDRIFMYARMRVTNAVADGMILGFNVDNGSFAAPVIQQILTPVINQWSDFSGSALVTGTPSANFKVFLQHFYADVGTANGSTMEVDGNFGVFAINMTDLGILDYTDQEMLDIVKSIGYFAGARAGTGEILPFNTTVFDNRAKITANKDLSNDFVIVEEETNDDITEAVVVKAVSMVNDNTEIYIALTEDATLKYDNGSNKVKHYELDTIIAGGTNIFLKTTVTKHVANDIHEEIEQYGQVVKVGV